MTAVTAATRKLALSAASSASGDTATASATPRATGSTCGTSSPTSAIGRTAERAGQAVDTGFQRAADAGLNDDDGGQHRLRTLGEAE